MTETPDPLDSEPPDVPRDSEIIPIGRNGDYIYMPKENPIDYTIHLDGRVMSRGAVYGCITDSELAQEQEDYDSGSPKARRFFRKFAKLHVLLGDELKRLRKAYKRAESILGLDCGEDEEEGRLSL